MNMTSGRAGAGAATTETSGGGGSCLAYGDGCLQTEFSYSFAFKTGAYTICLLHSVCFPRPCLLFDMILCLFRNGDIYLLNCIMKIALCYNLYNNLFA
jgi:hypothetical protein